MCVSVSLSLFARLSVWVSQFVRMVCVFVYICTQVGKCRVRMCFIRVCKDFFSGRGAGLIDMLLGARCALEMLLFILIHTV